MFIFYLQNQDFSNEIISAAIFLITSGERGSLKGPLITNPTKAFELSGICMIAASAYEIPISPVLLKTLKPFIRRL